MCYLVRKVLGGKLWPREWCYRILETKFECTRYPVPVPTYLRVPGTYPVATVPNRPSHNLLFAGVLYCCQFCFVLHQGGVLQFNGEKISHTLPPFSTRTPGGGTINAISRLKQQDGMV